MKSKEDWESRRMRGSHGNKSLEGSCAAGLQNKHSTGTRVHGARGIITQGKSTPGKKNYDF